MSRGDLPSQYELARLAAAVSGAEAATNSKQAVQKALALWRAATEELLNEHARREAEELKCSEKCQPPEEPSERQILVKTKEGTSPAMQWINEHAKYPRDKFKTTRLFWKAWVEFEPADADRFQKNVVGDVATTEEYLRQFLEHRSKLRRTDDASRKRKTRQKTVSKTTLSNGI